MTTIGSFEKSEGLPYLERRILNHWLYTANLVWQYFAYKAEKWSLAGLFDFADYSS